MMERLPVFIVQKEMNGAWENHLIFDDLQHAQWFTDNYKITIEDQKNHSKNMRIISGTMIKGPRLDKTNGQV